MINKGVVKFFNDEKGWGFIAGDDGTDFFVHQRQIQMDGYRTLLDGQTVTFESEMRDRGPEAVNVFVIEN